MPNNRHAIREPLQAAPVGVYLHVPFCVRKCAYCDFASFPGALAHADAYVDAVCAEIARRAGGRGLRADTVFVGGGTPSLLTGAQFARLMQAVRAHFTLAADAEITTEANPGTLTEDFLAACRAQGVNRVSLGAQAMQPRLLAALGRIHAWADVAAAVDAVRAHGIANINLDLMLGLPGQSRRDMADTLAAALALSPAHLSCYGLIVEEGTPLHARVQSGACTLPDEEEERAMYEDTRATLAARGYAQYEISNFARPGRACRHNLHCWQRREYLGFGAAAHSFLAETRRENPRALSDYLAGAPAVETPVAPAEARFESLMLGLRMTRGVADADFRRMHGVSIREAFGEKLDAPIAQGLLRFQAGRLRLTRRGMDVQNAVLVALM